MAADNKWPAVVGNLSRARAVWKRMTRIISRKGAELWVSIFFKDMMQAVLIFGAEPWVDTPCMGILLGGVPGPGGVAADREAPAAENLW